MDGDKNASDSGECGGTLDLRQTMVNGLTCVVQHDKLAQSP